MNFLKRAFLAVTRKRGRTFIMFILFAAIANMVLSGLAIEHATQSASALARQKLGGQLTLRFNVENAMQEARAAASSGNTGGLGGGQRVRVQTEPVTEEMAKTIAKQKDITGYNLVVNTNGVAQGFTAVSTDESQQQETASANSMQGRWAQRGGGDFVMPDVTVTGVSSSAMVDTFTNGDARIVSGRALVPGDAGKNAALIEKNLAEQNGLKVGDKITIKATRADDVVQYSVVGIYQVEGTSSSAAQGMRNLPFTEPYNRVFVDYRSALALKTVTAEVGAQVGAQAGTQTGGIDQAVFSVNDPKNIERVKADAEHMKLDWNKFTLDANDAAYKQMTGPIENVASFAKTVVYLVAIAGAIILSLVLMLSIKERMYETGVLLSMGEGKGKVIAQYVAEALIIAVVAFGLSLFSGRYIAQGVGNALLSKELRVTQEQQQDAGAGATQFGGGFGLGQRMGGFFGRQNTPDYQAIDSINVQITPQEAGQMTAAGLVIMILGTMLPAATVMRFKPKAILTNA